MANVIVEGQFKGKNVVKSGNDWHIDQRAFLNLIDGYEVASEGRRIKSGLGGAALGTLALGPIGLAGGMLAARKKRLAVITWRNGEESLIEVDSAALHSALVAAAFRNRK